MSEYISKTELKQELKKHLPTFHHIADEVIDTMPPADVAPVVHAHWKNVKRVLNSKWGECSNCDRCHEVTRYCTYCGAKMDESEANNNERT